MWLKHRKYSVHGKHEWSHSDLPFTHYILFHMSFPCSAIIYEAHKRIKKLLGGMLTESRFLSFSRVLEKRPQRCIDWWEGMIYVAPVSQLSSGPLSLITAIRLPSTAARLVCALPSQPLFCLISIKGKAVYFHLASHCRDTGMLKGCSHMFWGSKSYNWSYQRHFVTLQEVYISQRCPSAGVFFHSALYGLLFYLRNK